MLPLTFPYIDGAQTRILCLGAHADDIEIGCGGTILTLATTTAALQVTWVVFSSNEDREREARASADAILSDVPQKQILIERFRDGFFPYTGGDIKDYFEHLKTQVAPDLIFTHYRHDLHQDHRVISELTWNTFRKHLILEYEIPKYDGDLGSPNLFTRLDESIVHKKTQIILQFFQTQEHRHWFSADLFLALMRMRGVESAAPSSYAEAFYARKLVLLSRCAAR
jgi:LmbE family N-acetylglucosaminyl deacetylase